MDNGTAWRSLDIALNHNLAATASDRFSGAFIRGAGDEAMSTSYTSMIAYRGTNTVQICYDRLGNGWNLPPGGYGNTSAVFCAKVELQL